MPLNDFRSVFMPYYIERQPDGRYAVLNREYKPIGFFTRDYIRYSDHPILVKFKGLTAAKAKKISFEGNPDINQIYLYNDGCIPTHNKENMKAYLARLEILAKLTIVDINPPIHP